MASAGSEGDFDTYSIELTSKQFYNDMNKDHTDLNNYSEHCESIKWPKNEEKAKEICKKYVRYLKTTEILNLLNPYYDVCILLYYWIYDKLAQVFKAENTLDNVNKAFGNFQLIWSQLYPYSRNMNKNNKCYPDFTLVKHSDWKERKELYEYYVDYPTIKMISVIDKPNCNAYYEYLDGKAKLYEHFERKRSSEGYIFPQFYNNSNEYNPKELLHQLPCYHQISAKRKADSTDEPHLKESSSHLPGGIEPGHGDSKGGPGPAGSEFSIPVTQITSQSSDIQSKVANSVLGAAPVLFTATMLYRVPGFVD
ncbi:VIR protein [Plasmodium vivax]|uniref:VIR protein n=1 Tax=Plasmodium vivax TaxID=5855 RepID=A0A1G4ED37_PLAVI|nr:VIR protein [Plasmodium vivax]